ncbi:hypothetical protein M011DRAFT_529727 [Sporormia fimetaria CBS 119925]|uniref:Uncharacterized protein n=1 Tax=Sporormia fimetaria CBS 119925 TaxID=1340428 RepID=A0A6A6UYR7_9PLEO|nr:hypothetical protein M011DRAFT_529727 [Sporormia fimetaria CBS 119925]
MKAMKLSGLTLLSSLYCSAAAAATGHIFVYDPFGAKTDRSHTSTVTPETARLLLAHRLGLSQYHDLGTNVGDDVVELLNAFGGEQDLFADPHTQDKASRRALVWVEDVDDVDAIIKDQSAYTGHILISDPPAADANKRLVEDLDLQARAQPKQADPLGWNYQAENDIDYAHKDTKEAVSHGDFVTIAHITQPDGSLREYVRTGLVNHLEAIASAGERGWPLTVVLMPRSSKAKNHLQPYGQYRMPSSLKARRNNPEAVLSLSSIQPSTMPEGFASNDSPVVPQAKSNDTSPVVGILPPFFSSEEDCMKQTHNCSNHGVCRRAHSKKNVQRAEKGKAERYVCVCEPTVQHVGEDKGMESKRKVTYWGGPACQKKDVSQPFWLLAGSGVVLAFLISAAIGMMFSMGSEELPSVIGAGVSGPVRK